MGEYYHLYSISRNPCEYDELWYDGALANNLICRECGSINAQLPLPDIKLAVMPDKASLNFIPKTGLLVVSRDFVEALGDDVLDQCVDLGHLIEPGGELINGHYSFKGKYSALIRGNKLSSYRKCAECDRLLYYPKGKWYLISSQIGGYPIYHTQIGLVVEDVLYEKIKQTKPRKLGAGKIAIRDKASDGLDF